MSTVFNPVYGLVDSYDVTVEQDAIKNEPILYGASWMYAQNNGGDLTLNIMNRIKTKVHQDIRNHALIGYHPVIDTKTVLLMPGQYPCIPGWHCDGVIRKERGLQPDINTLNEPVYHYVCSINENGACPTEILAQSVDIDVDPENVWQSVNKHVENMPKKDIIQARSGDIVRFRRSTLHRGAAATERTWRFFFRLSFYHMPCMNEIRNQVQVYTTERGW